MPSNISEDEAPSCVTMPDLAPAAILRRPRAEKLALLKRLMDGILAPRAVLQLALNVLGGGKSGLSDIHLMNTYELIVINALGSGKNDVAKEYIAKLQKRFGRKSIRVLLLEGLCLEADGKFAEAKRHYGEILKIEPSNLPAVQRLSAIESSQGNLREAIRILETELIYTDENKEKHTLLSIHRSDKSNLVQLSRLYYEVGDVEKAIFYTEEELISNTDFYITHTRLGELFYQKKEFKKSMASYSFSLLLNGNVNNVRAMYGLRQATAKVLERHRKGTSKISDEDELHEIEEIHSIVGEKLKKIYAKGTLLDAIQHYLEATQC